MAPPSLAVEHTAAQHPRTRRTACHAAAAPASQHHLDAQMSQMSPFQIDIEAELALIASCLVPYVLGMSRHSSRGGLLFWYLHSSSALIGQRGTLCCQTCACSLIPLTPSSTRSARLKPPANSALQRASVRVHPALWALPATVSQRRAETLVGGRPRAALGWGLGSVTFDHCCGAATPLMRCVLLNGRAVPRAPHPDTSFAMGVAGRARPPRSHLSGSGCGVAALALPRHRRWLRRRSAVGVAAAT
jgi:hypothetical protein